MRNYLRFALDLAWVGLSPFLALFIRQNFNPAIDQLLGLSSYAFLCAMVAVFVILVARLPQRPWRYASLDDALRVMAAVTIILALALPTSFALNRLEGVARSLPAIQWLLLIAGMVGTRVAFRLGYERLSRRAITPQRPETPFEHVLIVGASNLTELYLRSVAEYAPAHIAIVGILSQKEALHGRFMGHKVLGAPDEIQKVLADLEVHGITIDRIVVTQSFERLSGEAQKALTSVEASSDIKVYWLVENLGLRQGNVPAAGDAEGIVASVVETDQRVSLARYHRVKRVIDVIVATCIIVVLAPVIAVVALIVATDVRFPVVFWQQRPGRFGRPFRLFKFRTMRSAHDTDGYRIPDAARCSRVGDFLRRSWLDEFPQLYNILVGEMSFVGPRPLLPLDQPRDRDLRLLVRPGLTGYAQVKGGRDLSPENKAALDAWYIMNASLWLDTKILLRTLRILISGGQLNGLACQAARGTEPMRTVVAVESAPTLLTDLNRLSASEASQAP
jgi:lipopolysaccharide/colanic/teichoic acid biosynthesis glycosyltransferase